MELCWLDDELCIEQPPLPFGTDINLFTTSEDAIKNFLVQRRREPIESLICPTHTHHKSVDNMVMHLFFERHPKSARILCNLLLYSPEFPEGNIYIHQACITCKSIFIPPVEKGSTFSIYMDLRVGEF